MAWGFTKKENRMQRIRIESNMLMLKSKEENYTKSPELVKAHVNALLAYVDGEVIHNYNRVYVISDNDMGLRLITLIIYFKYNIIL